MTHDITHEDCESPLICRSTRPLTGRDLQYIIEAEQERELQQCNGYQDLPRARCEDIDCPHLKECWSGE